MRSIASIAFALIATSASAQVLEADKARFATNLFASICLFGEGKAEAPREYIEFGLRPLAADAQSFFLGGRPGKAWGSEAGSGNFFVALTDDGECLVHVRRLAPSQAEHFFKSAVILFGEKASLQARPVTKETRADGEFTVLSYAMRAQSKSTPYEVKLTTTGSAGAPIQVTFSSRVRR